MLLNEYKKIMSYLRETIKGSLYENHVFAVGGCERDYRLGNYIKDIDLVIDLPGGGIKFANWLHSEGLTVWCPVVYEHFGTAMFCLKEFPDVELEAVQTRKECYHDMESRNPETAYGTIMDDCTRRDFTVNAFYYNISKDEQLDLNGNSTKDLADKIIRTCGDPNIIFNEDPLRVLRMVRFAARLDFAIEQETFECAKKYVDRLSIISKERIHDEFVKMCDQAAFWCVADAMFLLWDLNAFKYILPSIGALNNKRRYELINALKSFWYVTGGSHATVAELFAALLYDSPDAEAEMRNLKCCNAFIDEVMFYIKTNKEYYALFDSKEYNNKSEEFFFRKYMHRCGDARKFRIVLACGCDEMADYFFGRDYESGCMFEDLECVNKSFYTYQFPIDGYTVMGVLNIGPSKEVKDVLERLKDYVYKHPDKSSKTCLMNRLKKMKNIHIE